MAYATRDDLQAYVGLATTLPEDAERMLERASELIDVATLGRVDTTDESQAEAAKKATCAQVEFWMQTGEEHGILGASGGVQIGSLRVDQQPEQLAPRARRHLLMVGLLYRGIRQVSRTNALADQFFRPPGGW